MILDGGLAYRVKLSSCKIQTGVTSGLLSDDAPHRHHLNPSNEAIRNRMDETPLIKRSSIPRNNHSSLNRESRSKGI
jgi:hypothetical protein